MKTYSTLRNTIAVVLLAGAGLSGCAGDPFYDNRGYGYSTYSQPVYSQRYDTTNAQGNYYYDPNNPNRAYYGDRPYYYQAR